MMFTEALDKSAITLSIICIVHCLAVPVAVLMLPALTAYWFADESFHLALIYLVLPTSVLAIGLGCRRHRIYKIMFWGLFGLVTLIGAAFWGHEYFGEGGEKLLTIIGASLLVVAHCNNFRLCRSADCDC